VGDGLPQLCWLKFKKRHKTKVKKAKPLDNHPFFESKKSWVSYEQSKPCLQKNILFWIKSEGHVFYIILFWTMGLYCFTDDCCRRGSIDLFYYFRVFSRTTVITGGVTGESQWRNGVEQKQKKGAGEALNMNKINKKIQP